MKLFRTTKHILNLKQENIGTGIETQIQNKAFARKLHLIPPEKESGSFRKSLEKLLEVKEETIFKTRTLYHYVSDPTNLVSRQLQMN